MGAFSGVNRIACAEFYGVQKSSMDCLAAIRQMPSGDTPMVYNLNGYDRATRLPQYYQSGVFLLPSSDCMVQIELAGPQLPLTIDLIPNELKSMAAGVLETCTKKPRYVGGFLAGDLGPIRQWISSEPGDLDKPFPPSTAYSTVSVTTTQSDYISPGNYDPAMARMLAEFVFETARRYSPLSRLGDLLRKRAIRLVRKEEEMQPRGQRVTWWGRPGGGPRLLRPGEVAVNATEVAEGGGGGVQTARRTKRRKRVVVDEDQERV
ncbi:MAG: hypothetical protein L6R37_008039 [Teloschistes peruensis]|nr:MAG: hypothetical protein L6R37_008039 [Teloschistes peruensis]